MRKTYILRLTRLFTAMAAVVGVALHPASKLVDGVSGASRQRQQSNNKTSISDNSTSTSNNINSTSDNSSITSTNYNSNTTIATGWVREGANWTYIREGGSKATGWLNDGGKWYYLSSNGVMLTGWIKDSSGSWYYLDTSGVMLANTTTDGYTLSSDGRML